MNAALLRICHLCVRSHGARGSLVCPADGTDVAAHAESGECPRKLFDEPGIVKLGHGATGIVKALTGHGGASQRIIEHRTSICGSCPNAVMRLGVIQQCRLCGCSIWAKVRNAKERCPDNPPRWGRADGSISIVQLSRAGDILNVLPMMRRLAMDGRQVLHVVHRDFLSLVQGLSYLTPIPFDGGHYDVTDALGAVAGTDGEVIATQSSGNPCRQAAENFIIEPWVRAEMAQEWERLPLILDNRDAQTERTIHRQHVGTDRRPLVLFNTSGHSSRYPDGLAFVTWFRERFGTSCKLVNLAGVRGERFQDILGLYERAAVLVSTDTGTLHLGYATRTPTVGIVNDSPMMSSPRRPHWIERLTYSESQTAEGGERIIAAVETEIAKPRGPHIIHVVDDSWRPDPLSDDFRRLSRAAATWVGHRAWTTARIRTPRRTSESIGDTRRMPFIRDLFDAACELADPDDLVCFTNSDISLTPEAPDAIRAALAAGPCCYGPRTIVPAEVAAAEPIFTREQIQRFRPDACPLPSDGGTDLFAFRPDWWRRRREDFPDMVLGCAWWDVVMVNLMRLDNPDAAVYPPVIWHEDHPQFWKRPENIDDNPGQVYNRLLARKWLHARPGIGLKVPDKQPR